MPRVAPLTSWPISSSSAQPLSQRPARTYRSPSTIRLRTASSSANASSAVGASTAPGVFVTTTPRSRHASTSTSS